jgi:hypothetical protein
LRFSSLHYYYFSASLRFVLLPISSSFSGSFVRSAGHMPLALRPRRFLSLFAFIICVRFLRDFDSTRLSRLGARCGFGRRGSFVIMPCRSTAAAVLCPKDRGRGRASRQVRSGGPLFGFVTRDRERWFSGSDHAPRCGGCAVGLLR